MGAVAILKAMLDYNLNAGSIIIECPFGTMYQTVCQRFKMQKVPTFPMAGLLMFWGGVQNGFWAFSHNPIEYAKGVSCPTLLLYGGRDPKVSKQETQAIFSNLKGPKKLSIYPLAGHENYLLKYRKEWSADVEAFLKISSTGKLAA
jgi:pimeloyl-ACP methyl ester carboxylesterase